MKKTLIAALLVYLATSAVSYATFTALGGSSSGSFLNPGGVEESVVPTADPSNRLTIAPEAPKNQECPLNGAMYTQVEADSWATRRPLAVMIENHLDARPQSGLSKADVVYEAVVEGGITRFMPVYYCDAQAKDIIVAPVRSARQFFVEMVSDYQLPLYAHVGGANGPDSDPRVRSLENINAYGWGLRNDLNQFSIGYPTFVRNYNRVPGKDIATEHTMESSTERLWAVAEKRKYTNMNPDTVVRGTTVPGTAWDAKFVKWDFKDDAAAGDRGTTTKIAHEFWSGYKDFDVAWTYDSATNSYKRDMGGEPHVDQFTNQQIAAKNVLVLQMKEIASVDILHHNYIQTIGTGNGWLFQDGKMVKVTWSKKTRESRLTLTSAGKPVELVRGLVWISVVNLETEPTF